MPRAGAILAALALVSVAPARASAQFSNLFFFGDSFTDTGNATGLSLIGGLPNPTPPPYFPGRFSNGPVWSERFAAKLGMPAAAGPAWLKQGNNYAVGGATTDSLGSYGSFTGMTSQAAKFAKDNPLGVAPGGLFVLWGGGNDVLDAMTLGSSAQQTAAMATAASNIVTIASGLYKFFGATNFLIPFLPNVGSSPTFAGKPAQAALATSLTNTFNTDLALGLQGLGALPFMNVYGLSLNNLLTNVLFDASQGGKRYGITNTTTPCLALLQFDPNACDTALFADALHPSSAMSALIADAAYDRVINGRDVAVIPEPATMALVGGGLLVVMAAARRRRVA